MDLRKRDTSSFTAYGKSFASFGEIAQGRLSSGKDFLVSLPIDLWSECKLVCKATHGNTLIDAPRAKARQLAELLVTKLELQQGLSIQLGFESNIPIGKGLSSSTADLLAVIRAFESGFDFQLIQTAISELLVKIEQHDPLHYESCVAYDHRRGKLLQDFKYIPDYQIIGIDQGGTLSTQAYNSTLRFDDDYITSYDQLYHSLAEAFMQRDDLKIARCATKSAAIHARRTHNHWLKNVLSHAESWDILGVVATHSGTCAGVILPPDTSQSTCDKIIHQAQQYGEVFMTRTLRL
ncbi:hypothetical protein [Leucothrix pacifica]|uniref:GHMP family kinase ATP-binding protein n=1 Tax=Leucothrix pacifica TaxID=1247513 RepID=UPI0015E855D1|nr:hypothetical protein [Leucothrix pacifica]